MSEPLEIPELDYPDLFKPITTCRVLCNARDRKDESGPEAAEEEETTRELCLAAD